MTRRPPREIETEPIDPGAGRKPQPQRFAASRAGMVATQHFRATEAGVRMLAQGGNAIDAAVAAAFALGVCEPGASGLGGQTMMLLHTSDPRRTVALDGSSRAPHRVQATELTARQRRRGHRATTVPSTPAVLAYVLKYYGTCSLATVLEPAIELAESGYEVTELQHFLAHRDRRPLRRRSAGPFFLKDGRRPYKVGETFRQPVLGRTLRRLAEHGVEDFYLGWIAREIAADMEAHDGLVHLDDLAQIPWPIERRPITSRYESGRVFTFPPPGAGRTLVEMLNVVQRFPGKPIDPDTPRGAVALAELIRQAFRDRKDRPYDPNFYGQIPDEQMTSLDYAERLARRVRKRLKTHGETTHLSVMDRFGNVVALTQSIEKVFGACVATPSLGFLYNNYMEAFDYEDMSHPYYLRPTAVPWASVTPTIIFRGPRPWLVIGSPGSERIASSVLQVLIRLRTHTPLEAVAAPRLHCSLEGRVSLEAPRMRDDIPESLRRRGFEIDEREAWSFYLGCVQLVLRERGKLLGVADPRRDGSAGGPS